MYSQYWGLTGTPFENVVDAGWYHESPGHEEAMARLLFVAESHRRCAVLTGETGTGKSLVLAVVERSLARTQRKVVAVDLTGRSATELLWELAAGLQLAPAPRLADGELWRLVTDHLQTSTSACLPVVLLLDHPEHADSDALAAIRRLLKFDSRTQLSVLLATSGVRGFAGQVAALADLRVELPALERLQTEHYVAARLAKSGARRSLFSEAALRAVFERTGGVPREINRLCELSLVAASAFGDDQVDEATVHSVAQELEGLRDARDAVSWSA